MRRSTKISAIIHKLLIEKGMDGFTVIELRDASLSIDSFGIDPDEARRMVYRQILRFTKNNWLTSEGSGQKKRYFQTIAFKGLKVEPKAETTKLRVSSSPDYSILFREHSQYKSQLKVTLGEIEEYQSLNRRFPELEPRLSPLLEQAKERSANLLGKMNVLTSVFKTLSKDTETY